MAATGRPQLILALRLLVRGDVRGTREQPGPGSHDVLRVLPARAREHDERSAPRTASGAQHGDRL
jgi:hypothetical protein